MSIAEIIDYIIDGFTCGALGYNFACCIKWIRKYWSGIKIRKGERVTHAQIENRMALKLKLQSHGVMFIAILALYLIMSFGVGKLIFLFGSLTCCYFIIEGFNNIFGETLISQDVNDLKDFSLYLRPFISDLSRIAHRNEKTLNRVFSKYCQVFSIGNPSILFPSLGTASVFAVDDEWKETVAKMMDKAKIIIARVGQSEGSHWEINYIKENGLKLRTLFIVDSVISFKELQDNFGILCNYHPHTNGTCGIFYSKTGEKWITIPANNWAEIKRLFNLYLDNHPENLSHYTEYKKKKKHFWKYIFNRKNFPEQLSTISTGIISNPINYVILNRWSIPFMIFLALTNSIAFVIANFVILPHVWEIKYIGFISLPLYFYMFASNIMSIIYAPRISWISRIWPSIEIHNMQNWKMNRLQWDYIYAAIVYYSIIVFIVWLCTGQIIMLK